MHVAFDMEKNIGYFLSRFLDWKVFTSEALDPILKSTQTKSRAEATNIINVKVWMFVTQSRKNGYTDLDEIWHACITDSPLCRATLRCRGVVEQRAASSLPEALGDLGGLISFWSELGWLE
ncbi:jg6786 [Pararge aegeria aegeria]|uniref:Jg6786 protein n=1 Tax=Pararge aegeria aegeria TaxID=348720 RepID=A0A8S4RS50_9NEOP|nr:jg6786 [Pararge aegeria aegeria]